MKGYWTAPCFHLEEHIFLSHKRLTTFLDCYNSKTTSWVLCFTLLQKIKESGSRPGLWMDKSMVSIEIGVRNKYILELLLQFKIMAIWRPRTFNSLPSLSNSLKDLSLGQVLYVNPRAAIVFTRIVCVGQILSWTEKPLRLLPPQRFWIMKRITPRPQILKWEKI